MNICGAAVTVIPIPSIIINLFVCFFYLLFTNLYHCSFANADIIIIITNAEWLHRSPDFEPASNQRNTTLPSSLLHWGNAWYKFSLMIFSFHNAPYSANTLLIPCLIIHLLNLHLIAKLFFYSPDCSDNAFSVIMYSIAAPCFSAWR